MPSRSCTSTARRTRGATTEPQGASPVVAALQMSSLTTELQGASPVVWLKTVTSDAGELHGILDLYYLRFKSCLICMVVDQIKEWLEHSLLDHFIVARLWSGPN